MLSGKNLPPKTARQAKPNQSYPRNCTRADKNSLRISIDYLEKAPFSGAGNDKMKLEVLGKPC